MMESSQAQPRVGRREMLAWSLVVLLGAWATWLSVQRFAPNLFMSAAQREVQAVHAEVRRALKDPDSARFVGVWVSQDRKYACGQVNAKNAMGGYAGNSSFLVRRETGDVEFMPSDSSPGDSLQDQLGRVQEKIKFMADMKRLCGQPGQPK